MKSTTPIRTAGVIATMAMTLIAATAQGPGGGRGMPAEARETIHGLFDSHDKFKREVNKTDDGYVSKTTSKDPAMVKLLQTHVKQMEKRLKQGLMVRRWDPAYEEFVSHYDDIEIKITNIENGISITAVGANEDARKVARNHAGIISKFIQNGWSEHDKTHPAVVTTGGDAESDATAGGKEGELCAECAKPQANAECCRDGDEPAGNRPCCDEAAGDQGDQKSDGEADAGKTHPAPAPVEACALGSTKPIHAVGNIYLAGQPAPEDFKLAEKQGIKTVINLRHDKEIVDYNEQEVVEAAGLRYLHLPWNGADELTDDTFDRTRKLLETAERPILLHCGSSNRVGAVWLPWRVLNGGVELEKAVAEAKLIGLKKSEYEQKARDYIRRNQEPK